MNFFKKIFDLGKKTSIPRIAEEDIDKLPKVYSGRFHLNDFPESIGEEFYFFEYLRPDGEWIEVGEPVCEFRVGEFCGYLYTSEEVIASKGGILEHTLKKDDLLSNGKEIYKLHPIGSYHNENVIDNFEYKEYFRYQDFKYSFKWLVDDGDYVEIGDPIFEFDNSDNKIHRNFAKKAGFIHQIDPKLIIPEFYELIYVIRENDKQRINERFVNHPEVITDEFTNTTNIKWDVVSSKYGLNQGIVTKSDNLLIDFFFSFNYINNNDYIVFNFYPGQIRPKKFDKISFLFENGEKIHFELTANPVSLKNRNNENILEYKSLITKPELELFTNSLFKKWKISLVNDNVEILGGEVGGDDYYLTKKNIQIAIKKFSNDYINLVRTEIPDYKPTELRKVESVRDETFDFCFVYLMHDTSNGFYKIGISNNPEYRERTLQSEKPTIDLITLKKFPVRKIAESFERALHETYSAKRLRGEWFELSSEDVEHISKALD